MTAPQLAAILMRPAPCLDREQWSSLAAKRRCIGNIRAGGADAPLGRNGPLPERNLRNRGHIEGGFETEASKLRRAPQKGHTPAAGGKARKLSS